jgi:RNA polymerase sigma-70 factor (ECF subfamily)
LVAAATADPSRARVIEGVAPEGEASSTTTHERWRRIAIEEYDFVWRSLRRLGVLPPETDDAAQQVFVILAKKLSSIEVGKERSYVFSIVLRVAANVRRARAKLREVAEEEATGVPSVAPAAEENLDHAHARALLDELIAGMPDERRAVFVLFELEELTIPEIAEMLQLPLGTVGSRLRRAREDLRAAIARLRARKQGV